jgi:hypothetical protein
MLNLPRIFCFLPLIFICCAAPTLILKKETLPETQGSYKYSHLRKFTVYGILDIRSDSAVSEKAAIGEAPNVRYLNRYTYFKNAESIAENAIIDVLKSQEGVRIVGRETINSEISYSLSDVLEIEHEDLEKLRSKYFVECLVLCRIHHARKTLTHKENSFGNIRSCDVPEVSISLEIISLETGDAVLEMKASLNMLQFIEREMLINECPPQDMEWLIIRAVEYCLEPYTEPEKVDYNKIHKRFSQSGDTARFTKELNEYLLLNPECYQCSGDLAWINLKTGDIPMFRRYTLEAYKGISHRNPLDMHIKCYYAYVKLLDDKVEIAEKVLREAIKTYGDNEILEEIRKTLKFLYDYEAISVSAGILYSRLFEKDILEDK